MAGPFQWSCRIRFRSNPSFFCRLPRRSPPSFFWFSQTIGPGRGIEEFLAAWVLTRGASQACLLGDISDSFRAGLTSLVPEERRQWIKFLPLTSPRELEVVIASQDLGLALEPNTPESRYLTVTNKIFQYLNAGLAVIASPTAGQLEVMSSVPESGLVVDLGNPRIVAEQLDSLLSNPGPPRRDGSRSLEGGGAAILLGSHGAFTFGSRDLGYRSDGREYLKATIKRILASLGWSLHRSPPGVVMGFDSQPPAILQLRSVAKALQCASTRVPMSANHRPP